MRLHIRQRPRAPVAGTPPSTLHTRHQTTSASVFLPSFLFPFIDNFSCPLCMRRQQYSTPSQLLRRVSSIMAERTSGIHTSGSGSGLSENLNSVPPSSVASITSMSVGDASLLAPPSPSSMGLGRTTSFASSLSSLSSTHLRERLRVPVDAIQAQASRAHSAAATALRERVE